MMTIKELLTHFETGADLAKACGRTRQAVYQWSPDDLLAPEYVLPVCRALGGKLTPHQIRSDIYPDPKWVPPVMKKKAAG